MSETTASGNRIERAFYCGRERYFYDWGPCSGKNWVQYDTDQDFRCFGVWVNASTREILTFAEGDEILVTCETEALFRAELKTMADFYGSPPPAMYTYGPEGERTAFYDERGLFGREIPLNG